MDKLKSDHELAQQIASVIDQHGEDVLPRPARNFYHHYMQKQNGGSAQAPQNTQETLPQAPTIPDSPYARESLLRQAQTRKQTPAQREQAAIAAAGMNPNAYDEMVGGIAAKGRDLKAATDRKIETLRKFREGVERREDSWADLGTGSDTVREFSEGAVSGLGAIAAGMGQLSSFVRGNDRSEFADSVSAWFNEQAKNIDSQQAIAYKQAMLDSTPEGDLFDLSTWSMSGNWSMEGILGHIAQMGGQLTPQLVAGILTGGGGLVAGAAVGGLQAGGGASQEQEEYVNNMSEDQLYENSQMYVDLRSQGKSHEEAQRDTANMAGRSAFFATAPLGALGGAATNYILRPLNGLMSGSSMLKAGLGKGLVSGIEEGAQEVAEGVVAKYASNEAIGGNQNITEGSLTNAALGAGIGGGLGVASGVGGAIKAKAQNAADKAVKRQESNATYQDAVTTGSYESMAKLFNEDAEKGAAAAIAVKRNPSLKENHGGADEVLQARVQQLNTILKADLSNLGEKESTERKAKAEEALAELQRIGVDIADATTNPEDRDAPVEERVANAVEKVTSTKSEAEVIADEENITTGTEQADAKAAKQEVEDAIEDVIIYTMNNPEAVTTEQVEQILASGKASERQERYLKGLVKNRADLLKKFGGGETEMGEVSRRVRNGSVGFKGLSAYLASGRAAAAVGDFDTVKEELTELNAFRKQMKSKADAVNAARGMVRNYDGAYAVYDKKAKTWSAQQNKPTSGNPGVDYYHVHSGSGDFIRSVTQDADAIANTFSTLRNEAVYLKNQKTRPAKEASIQNQVNEAPQGENVESPETTTSFDEPTDTDNALNEDISEQPSTQNDNLDPAEFTPVSETTDTVPTTTSETPNVEPAPTAPTEPETAPTDVPKRTMGDLRKLADKMNEGEGDLSHTELVQQIEGNGYFPVFIPKRNGKGETVRVDVAIADAPFEVRGFELAVHKVGSEWTVTSINSGFRANDSREKTKKGVIASVTKRFEGLTDAQIKRGMEPSPKGGHASLRAEYLKQDGDVAEATPTPTPTEQTTTEAPAETVAEPEAPIEDVVEEALTEEEVAEAEADNSQLTKMAQHVNDPEVTRAERAKKPIDMNRLIAFFQFFKTKSPMARIDRFVSNLTVDKAVAMITEEGSGDINKMAKQTAIHHYLETMKGNGEKSGWIANAQRLFNQVDNKDLRFRNFLRYFEGSSGNIAENVLASVATASYLHAVEKLNAPVVKTVKETNKMVGREEKMSLTPNEWKLQRVGDNEDTIISSLGDRAIQILGLQAMKDIPANERERMTVALGTAALVLLKDAGLYETYKLPLKDFLTAKRRGMDEKDPRAARLDEDIKNATKIQQVSFIRPKRFDSDGNLLPELPPEMEEFVTSNKGSGNAVGDLFKADAQRTFPSFRAPKFTQSKVAKSVSTVPSVQKNTLSKEQERPHKMRTAMTVLWSQMSLDQKKKFAGYEDIGNAHPGLHKTIEGRNQEIDREIESMDEWIEMVNGEAERQGNLKKKSVSPFDVAFYFPRAVWNNFRVGISSNAINPQASKLTRHMIEMDGWESNIDMNVESDKMAFLLGVAEGLGISVDKQLNAKSVEQAEKMLAEGDIKDAAEILKKVHTGEVITKEEWATIEGLVGVNRSTASSKHFHKLEVLTEYSKYLVAKDSGTSKVTTTLWREVDGITNGPILLQLALGMTDTPFANSLKERLKRGGIYQKEDGFKHYTDYAQNKANDDTYKGLVKRVHASLTSLMTDAPLKAPFVHATWRLLGDFVDADGFVTSAGRNAVKPPITGLMYGSGVTKAATDVSLAIEPRFYRRIEELRDQHDALPKTDLAGRQAIEMQLSYLAADMNTFMLAGDVGAGNILRAKQVPSVTDPSQKVWVVSVNDAMQMELTSKQSEALRKGFGKEIAPTIQENLEDEFAAVIEMRTLMNKAVSNAYTMYNTAYQIARKEYIQRLADLGEIPVSDKGYPLWDLNKEQEAEVRAMVEHISPRFHTPLSKQSQSIRSGFDPLKTTQTLSKSGLYQQTLQHNPTTVGYSSPQGSYSASTQTSTIYGREQQIEGPGVRTIVGVNLATDSTISMIGQKQLPVYNFHDANGISIKDVEQGAKNLNKATFDTLVGYHMPIEVMKGVMQASKGYKEFMTPERQRAYSKEFKDAETEMQKNSNFKESKWSKNAVANGKQNWVNKGADHLHELTMSRAIYGTQNKLKALLDAYVVDQYGLQFVGNDADGNTQGGYVLTDQDRQTIQRELDYLETPTQDAPVEPDTETWGELGDSGLNDPALVTYMNNNKRGTIQQAMPLLRARIKQTMAPDMARNTLHLMSQVMKVINPNTQLNLVTASQKALKQTDGTDLTRAKGFTVGTKQGSQIWVKSADFASAAISVELVLHEMLHAALAQAINNPNKENKQFIEELKDVHKAVEAAVKADPALSQFLPAVTNVHEMVSWGMTNPEFAQIMAKVPYKSNNLKSKAVQALEGFLESIKNILIPSEKGRQQSETALYALLANTHVLLAQEAEKNKTRGKNKKKQSTPESDESTETKPSSTDDSGASDNTVYLQDSVQAPTAYKTEEVLTGLLVNDSTSDSKGLKDLLGSIVDALHGPFGAYAIAPAKQATLTMQDTFVRAMQGTQPFVSKALTLGLTHAEAFVTQQLELTMNAAFDTKTNVANSREMMRVFRLARKKLTPADLPAGAYDMIFNSRDNPKEYLARFVALSQTYPELKSKLANLRVPSFTDDLVREKLGGKLQRLVMATLSVLSSAMPNTLQAHNAGDRLAKLLQDTADNEARYKDLLAKERAASPNALESMTTNAAAKLRKSVADFTDRDTIKNHESNVVKSLAGITNTIASKKGEELLNGLRTLYNTANAGRNGIMGELANDLIGATNKTEVFYKLLRISTDAQRHRKQIIDNVTKLTASGFSNNAKDYTTEQKAAVTKVFLRLDVQSIYDDYHVDDNAEALAAVIGDNATRQKEIQATMAKLTGRHKEFYIGKSKQLAYHLATGRSGGEHMLLNAHNIAHLMGMGIKANEAAANQPHIDKLITLLAIDYTGKHSPQVLSDAHSVLVAENQRSGPENGVVAAVYQHRALQKEAKEVLFARSEVNYMKGYVKETFNPHKEMLLIDVADLASYKAKGYVQAVDEPLKIAKGDPNKTAKILVTIDRPASRRITGVMGLTAKRTRGTKVSLNQDLLDSGMSRSQVSEQGKRDVYKAQHQGHYKRFSNPNFDPERTYKESTWLVPAFGEDGRVSSYRYLMEDSTKQVLEPDNDITHVVGRMSGQIYDKQGTEAINSTAVRTLKDQYKNDPIKLQGNYIRFSPDSEDREIREAYSLLPEHTRKQIRSVWGKSEMMVPKEVYNMMFGYHAYTIGNMFDKRDEGIHTNMLENSIMFWGELFLGKKAANRLANAEAIWNELASMVKDTVVIKNLFTLLGNDVANASLMWMWGVPATDMVSKKALYTKAILNYQRDSNELTQLQAMVKSGFLGGQVIEDVQDRMAELEDAIERNPTKELIDANLFQTIAEDVDSETDQYSHLSQFSKWTSEKTAYIPDSVKTVGKSLFLTHDTPVYKLLAQGTAISDFVARCTLYDHLIKTKSKEEALKLVDEAFVNYDLPQHKGMNYMNDTGLMFFMKYFIRIQKPLILAMQENPARTMVIGMLEAFAAGTPTVLDSGAWEHIGNIPIDSGALKLPSVIDDILPIHMILSLFN